MDFFGVGPFEILFIILIMLVVLGPRDMVKTGRNLGRAIRKIIRSPLWASMMNTSRELREIPTRLVRESGIEEEMKTLRQQADLSSLTSEVMTEMARVDTEVRANIRPASPATEAPPPFPEDDPTLAFKPDGRDTEE